MKNYPTSLGRPVDATAARVVRSGEHYEPNLSPSYAVWDAPPPTLPVTNSKFNHIGERQGRLVIIGLLDQSHPTKGSTWLARCDCGLYCVARGRSWRKWDGQLDKRCPRCQHIARQQFFYNRDVVRS